MFTVANNLSHVASLYHLLSLYWEAIVFLETIDLISSFILQRFDQPGLKTYQVLQDLLLNAVTPYH